jgi:hypothetical protein
VEFDPGLATAFGEMMRQWDGRIQLHSAAGDPTPAAAVVDR